MLKVFNTLTRKVQTFKPIKKGQVGLYTCGPTVYNFAHIGNFRSYIFADLLKRYLKYSGFKVKHVMNITDVDDKTIRDSQQAKQTLKEFTNYYLKAFIEDINSLNIQMPDILPKATEHISEIVALVKKIDKNGYCYTSDQSVYFDISKFTGYGKLAQLDKQDLKHNADGRLNISDEYEKEQINDFALWKAWRPEHGKVFWDTEIGKGHPGWHIECSAMSMKYLGENFDIHTGGVDLIFPHHTNEIAQSEAATKKKFVNYWMHNEHLLVQGKKMSKSLGNFYTLRDLADKGYNLLLMRFILLKTHYRKILNFSPEDFKEAESAAVKLLDFLINLEAIKNKSKNKFDIKGEILKSRNDFKKSMDDDLNISLGLASLFNFVNQINKVMPQLNLKQAQEIKKYLLEVDSVLGFIEALYKSYQKELSGLVSRPAIKKMLSQRAEARNNQDYQKADQLRKELAEKGIVIDDTQQGGQAKLLKMV
jgi:cysteinyl-tRNA synthetase